MAILLVTYDLRQPGRNYTPVHDFLKTFTHCKGMESVWLLDTAQTVGTVRDRLTSLVDVNDRVFVAQLSGQWGSWNYTCGDWLNDPARSW